VAYEIYLIRRKADGAYYRKEKKRYGQTRRTAWTEDPSKAWHPHSKRGAVSWYKNSRYCRGESDEEIAAGLAEIEVVTFKLVETRVDPA
jgi:hypothetical protein